MLFSLVSILEIDQGGEMKFIFNFDMNEKKFNLIFYLKKGSEKLDSMRKFVMDIRRKNANSIKIDNITMSYEKISDTLQCNEDKSTMVAQIAPALIR